MRLKRLTGKLGRREREKIQERDRDRKRNSEEESERELKIKLALTSFICPFHYHRSYSGRDSKPRREKDQSKKREKRTLWKKPPLKEHFPLFVGSARRNFLWRVSSSMVSLTWLKAIILDSPFSPCSRGGVTRRNREVVNFKRYHVKNNTELTNLMKMYQIQGYNGKYGSNPQGI